MFALTLVVLLMKRSVAEKGAAHRRRVNGLPAHIREFVCSLKSDDEWNSDNGWRGSNVVVYVRLRGQTYEGT
jgi:hypothetical protein